MKSAVGVCGSAFMVFLATLFVTVSAASANNSGTTNPTMCNTPVSGKVVLKQDLTCINSDGLIVMANNTTIYLGGYSIRCMDPAGYKLSCQGGDIGDVPGGGEALDFGIDTNGKSNVKVFGPGQIQGFDIGVYVFGGPANGPTASNIDVKRVNITGPDGDADLSIFSAFPRPNTWGILVQNVGKPIWCNKNDDDDDDDHHHGVLIYQNMVENHAEGIALYNASRVNVFRNFVHDNNDAGDNELSAVQSHGIVVCANTPLCQQGVSKNNKIFHNLVVDNGMNVPAAPGDTDADGGITLSGSVFANKVLDNSVLANNGDGISVRDGATNNRIFNNVSLYNTTTGPIDPVTGQPLNPRFWDIAERNAPVNSISLSNRCLTESPGVNAAVCNPGESEPWK